MSHMQSSPVTTIFPAAFGGLASPVFLVGAARSGTTLLRLMLDHHPQIAFPFEFEFGVDFLPESGWPDMHAYRDWLSTHRAFQQHGLAVDPDLDCPNLVRSFLDQAWRRSGKPIMGATVHHRHFHRLIELWPDARFIHILRDGRDVARSVVSLGWAGHCWHAAQWWIEAERTWQRLRAKLAPGQWTDVTYEELVTSPEPVLARLCTFIGVEFDGAMLDYSRHSRYERPDPKLIGQWRHKMTEREVQLVESRIGDMLVERGYSLSGFPCIRTSAATRLWLGLRSRLGRAIFRVGRYGSGLFLQELVARRLGMRPWQRRLKVRMNQIEQNTLK
jgi:hypothetical protein